MIVKQALSDKRLLITGASGFLGKVWLTHLISDLPELAEIVIVLRRGRYRSVRARFEDLVESSAAFRSLHERFGDELGGVLGAKLEVLEGDVTRPDCGLSADEVERLRGRVDLVVHVASLTNMEPTLVDALSSNVDGALNALGLTRALGARLLHVSSAYVAGKRLGRVAERIEPDYAPRNHRPGDVVRFDARKEVEDLRRLQARVEAESRDQSTLDRFRSGLRDPSSAKELERERTSWVRRRLLDEALARARHWGWANFYTMTKSLAESLILRERGDVQVAVVRPTIVECALRDPFPGWKEGLQTSGPITFSMIEGPLRSLPSRATLALDLIPVDFVARGMTLVAAWHLTHDSPAGAPPRVFHLGSSDDNPLPMFRVIELNSMAQRESDGRAEAPLDWRRLLIPDGVPSGDREYEAVSVPLYRKLGKRAREALDVAGGLDAPEGSLLGKLAARARKLSRDTSRADRKFRMVERAVELFRPFVLENDCVYATDGIRELVDMLSPAERELFGYDMAGLDWRRYFLDVHIPGLRRWVFPRLRGKRLEAEPRRPVTMVWRSPVEAR